MHDRILIVDDDRFLLDSLRKLLQREGYEVATAPSGEEAMNQIMRDRCDLMILDLGLPGADGVTTCRRLRAWHTFPIIMLTARSDAIDKVIGLEVGADDYLTKPFEPSELIARVRAHLRRTKEYVREREQASEGITVGEVRVDLERREVTLAGRPVVMTAREFDLVAHLAQNRGRVVSRESLFEAAWGYDAEFSTNSLDVHLYRVRKKLETDPAGPRYLHTVRGYGYRFGGDESG
jgi:DNA-binding response OmpR family regulator